LEDFISTIDGQISKVATGMSGSKSLSEKTKEELNKFRKDLSLIIVGLFLALGIQSIIQFVEVSVPHINGYYYLGLGIGSLILVLEFIHLAAKYAGLDEAVKRESQVTDGRKSQGSY